MSEIERNRQLRRRHMHERQAVVFGVLLAGLALVGLGAAAVYTGNLDLPGLDRAIAQAPSPTEIVQPYPCPPAGALPVPYAAVTVNVNNATTRVGLAGATAEALKQRGFTIGTTSTVDGYDGVARISFGKNGVAQAYTLLAQFDGATMLALGGEDPTVNVALGAQFVELKPLDAVTLDPAVPLVAPAGCMPYEEFASTAQTPAPAPAG
ncbi:LytR C-terminal domain-containing protein [Cellulomonas sp. URHE0023]|uniref:LytR C-terminal domain-containing protein n=1 Tax=Cellulomonas sp. URHE0023 TaxID=1380354 RepID=UPI0004802A5E|nr:LytR C-terminal domain-containing protein [Cellulomonas sp. URHE0023]